MQHLDLCLLNKKKKTVKIHSKKILSLASNLVSRAKKELLLTMLIKQELKKPLPLLYIKLLQKKAEEGVKIERLCFGSKREYKKIIIQPISKGIQPYNIKDISCYQRMLMKDRKEMVFAIPNKKEKNQLFYSNDKKVIKRYLDYFVKTKFSSEKFERETP